MRESHEQVSAQEIQREEETQGVLSQLSQRIQQISTNPGEIFSKLSELSQTLQTSILNLRTSETSQDDREEVDISKTFIGQQDSLNNLKVIELLNGLILNAFKDTQHLDSIKMDDSTPKNSLLRILKESNPTTLLSGMNLMGILHVATEDDDLNVRNEKGRRISELKKGDKICLTMNQSKKPKVIKGKPSGKDNLFVHVEKPDGTAIGYICAKYVQTNSSKEHYSQTMQKAREAEQQKAELPQLKEQIKSSNDYFVKLFSEPSSDERASKSFQQLIKLEPFKSHLEPGRPLYRINMEQNTTELDKISYINNTHSEFSKELARFQKMIRIFENYHMTLKAAQENSDVFEAKQNYVKNRIEDIKNDLAINDTGKYRIENHLNKITHQQTDWQNLEIQQLEFQNKNNKLVYSLHLFLHTYITPLNKEEKKTISLPLIKLLEASRASTLYEAMNNLRTIILEKRYETQNRDPYKNPSFYLTARKASRGTSLTPTPDQGQRDLPRRIDDQKLSSEYRDQFNKLPSKLQLNIQRLVEQGIKPLDSNITGEKEVMIKLDKDPVAKNVQTIIALLSINLESRYLKNLFLQLTSGITAIQDNNKKIGILLKLINSRLSGQSENDQAILKLAASQLMYLALKAEPSSE